MRRNDSVVRHIDDPDLSGEEKSILVPISKIDQYTRSIYIRGQKLQNCYPGCHGEFYNNRLINRHGMVRDGYELKTGEWTN